MYRNSLVIRNLPASVITKLGSVAAWFEIAWYNGRAKRTFGLLSLTVHLNLLFSSLVHVLSPFRLRDIILPV